MASRMPSVEERLRQRRCAARDRAGAALVTAIARRRARMHRYLDLGLAQKAVHEYALMLDAKGRLAEWQRTTARWGDDLVPARRSAR